MSPNRRARGPEPVVEWDRLRDDFKDADLLLGNGFSLTFDGRFAYSSLFEDFLGRIKPQEQSVFRAFGTTNFEAILEQFSHAITVNAALSLDVTMIKKAADFLRNNLIRAIQRNHPKYGDLDQRRLNRASETLDGFGDVFTLNYDVILYHIVMISKDRNSADRAVRPYNDYFWKELTSDYLQFMSFQDYPHYKHLYYLHGALFLFHQDYLDVKLRRTGSFELITEIALEVQSGELPLFVSEGRSEEKRLAISRSDYLGFAQAKFREKRDNLVIYGASLGSQDEHIAEAIQQSTDTIAYSVHTAGKSASQVQSNIAAVRAILPGKDIRFFDSSGLFQ